jgi:uncharacterized membrane protein
VAEYNQIAGQRVGRVEALADGVVAIAITLLVLDIRVPVSDAIATEADLIAAFGGLLPKLLVYFLSFMTLGIFWTGHATQFHFIRQSDRKLNWISLFFLLFVSILPFTTAFLGQYIEFRFAVGVYWLNILLLGVFLYLHWTYAVGHGFVTLTDAERAPIDAAIRRRIIIAQTLYAAAALLAFVNTYLSIAVIILIQLNYALGLFRMGDRTRT